MAAAAALLLMNSSEKGYAGCSFLAAGAAAAVFLDSAANNSMVLPSAVVWLVAGSSSTHVPVRALWPGTEAACANAGCEADTDNKEPSQPHVSSCALAHHDVMCIHTAAVGRRAPPCPAARPWNELPMAGHEVKSDIMRATFDMILPRLDIAC